MGVSPGSGLRGETVSVILGEAVELVFSKRDEQYSMMDYEKRLNAGRRLQE